MDCGFVHGEAAAAPQQTTRASFDERGRFTGFEFFQAFADCRAGFLPQGALYRDGRVVLPTPSRDGGRPRLHPRSDDKDGRPPGTGGKGRSGAGRPYPDGWLLLHAVEVQLPGVSFLKIGVEPQQNYNPTCLVPPAPPGADINANIRESEKHLKEVLTLQAYVRDSGGYIVWFGDHARWFYNQVKGFGPWDYKNIHN